uniref:Ubiquitin-conjugating enzyme E2 n=1 Tax=Babesia bovis TaxID=5865 RepID=S6C866_BABBO|nr:ubiquitin-conjugating enzyme E2 [Babesia bovis]
MMPLTLLRCVLLTLVVCGTNVLSLRNLRHVNHSTLCFNNYRNRSYFNRLEKELDNFRNNPPPNCTLEVFGSRKDIWIITWVGLPGTIYEGETYRPKILFPKEYPLKAPTVYFLQPGMS